MSRPLRIEIENGTYHVTARGWERHVLVCDDRDRQEWFKLLDYVVGHCGRRFFAWVLMDNRIRKRTSVSVPQLATTAEPVA